MGETFARVWVTQQIPYNYTKTRRVIFEIGTGVEVPRDTEFFIVYAN